MYSSERSVAKHDCCKRRYRFFDTKTGSLILSNCNSWLCARCCKRRAIYHYVLAVLAGWSRVRMLTLGITSQCMSKEEHLRYMQKAWSRLTWDIRRSLKHARDFQYLRVNEVYKSGYFHMHVLINVYLPQEVIYLMWNRILRSVLPSEVSVARDFKQLGSVNLRDYGSQDSSKRVARNYVAKAVASNYLLKQLSELVVLYGMRVFTKSQNLPRLHQKGPGWYKGRYVRLDYSSREWKNLLIEQRVKVFECLRLLNLSTLVTTSQQNE
jgi:hypothetical protein